MSAPDSGAAGRHALAAPAHPPSTILRFRLSERQMHWAAIAIPFMICYASAVVLIGVDNPDSQRPYRAFVSWAHRGAGVCLGLLPLWVLTRHWAEVALFRRNVHEAWRWTVDDVNGCCSWGPRPSVRACSCRSRASSTRPRRSNFMLLTATWPLYPRQRPAHLVAPVRVSGLDPAPLTGRRGDTAGLRPSSSWPR